MSDLDDWAERDGPEPPWLRKVLDAGRDVPDMPPEQAAKMERVFLEMLAEERRKEARARRARWTRGAVVVMGTAAAMVMLRFAVPREPVLNSDHPTAVRQVPTAIPTGVATSAATGPPAEGDADAGVDAGAGMLPGRRGTGRRR